MKIGDVAERVGTTPRTIRYYEEIGLLPTEAREAGAHRSYEQGDVERLETILRLKELLGVPLDELRELVDARVAFRATADAGRRRDIARSAVELYDRQLELVRDRRAELDRLEAHLLDRRARVEERLA